MASRTISVTFLGDATKLKKTVAEVDGLSGKVSKSFKGIASVAATAVGAFAGIEFGKQLISSASDLNESISKTQVIFGGASTEILRWSQTTASALGTSRQEALDAAATFATFGKSAGLSGTSLSGFAENLTGLSADLASFYNASPTEAIDAIGAALRGESEPIRRFGVLLDDATLKNEALKLGLIKTTKDALTPQQKVLAAQASIMRQTSDAQGDFGRTSGGLANQQRILSAKFADVKAKIGSALIPVLTKLASFVSSKVIPAISKMAKWIGDNKDLLLDLTLAIAPFVVALGTIMAVQKVTAAVTAFNAVLAANPIVLVVLAIAALVAGLIWAYHHVEWFRDGVDAVGRFFRDKVAPIIAQFGEGVRKVFTWIKDHWEQLWPKIKEAWDKVGYPIVSTVGTVIGTIVSGISTAVQGIGVAFTTAWSIVKLAWDTLGAPVFEAIGTAVESAGSVISGLADTVGGAFGSAIAALREAWNGFAQWWNDKIGGKGFDVPDFVPFFGGKSVRVPHLPELAKGGTATRGGLALVGERGAEVVDLPAGASVYPMSRVASGGMTVIVNCEAPPGADARYARWLGDLIAKQIRDSGPVGVALQGTR